MHTEFQRRRSKCVDGAEWVIKMTKLLSPLKNINVKNGKKCSEVFALRSNIPSFNFVGQNLYVKLQKDDEKNYEKVISLELKK